MPNRATRRAALRKANKLDRQAGIGPLAPPPTARPAPAVPPVEAILTDIPEPGRPFPLLAEMRAKGADPRGHSEPLADSSSAFAPEAAPVLPAPEIVSPSRLAANRVNAQKSTGPLTDEGKAISSQNRLTHGLARHNGRFALLPTEDAAEFDTLRNTYFAEEQPANQLESDLVQVMVETLWMRNRAQNLQPSCFDPTTGALADAKLLALFIRYENTYNRAFSTAFKDLLRARAERRKVELGFEAQKRREQAERRAQEKHQMQKDKHYWEVLKADGEACNQVMRNIGHKIEASIANPEFRSLLEAELAKNNVKSAPFGTAVAA